MNFAEQLAERLVGRGYTHCMFVAGGNIMHLVEACRTRFTMVPVVHEFTAVVAAEYFNETHAEGHKAFALVTAGPGLTNAVTGISGAWLESREVLIIGGQVKSADLARNGVRQLGIQEIDGIRMVNAVTKAAVRLERPITLAAFDALVESGRAGRPGPVFVEICLDAQASPALAPSSDDAQVARLTMPSIEAGLPAEWAQALEALRQAERPLILLGGGVDRRTARRLRPRLESLGIPVALTWNAMDRLPADSPVYAGRPNTWGMRWANLAIQQSDLVLALGTRLGLQQTGFAWQDFAPLARIAQVDVDPAELGKGRPRIEWAVRADANEALASLVEATSLPDLSQWRDFVALLRRELPVVEDANLTAGQHLVPQVFVQQLSELLNGADILIPSSSGGSFTVAMQVFENKAGQTIVSNKALASMGYGLAGAIGAALANPSKRVVLTEGDGGFAQNLQEVGTVSLRGLNLKIFLMVNGGYASIRMTQRNYFGGAYVGCDRETGLGLPNWERLAAAWSVPYTKLDRNWTSDPTALTLLDAPGPALLEVTISSEQTYWPKIGSRVLPDGSMASAPLHMMSPGLTTELATQLMPFLSKVNPDESD